MTGLELVREDGLPDTQLAAKIVRLALKDGLILLAGGPDGNVLTFTPPFCIEPEEIDFACNRIQGYLRLGSVS
jgi:4-aminobutyrate aminotransferase-like enzyme